AWARYDTTVLADVPADALPPGATDLLERYTRDLGRGLVMTGGPDSFGPGGYADTPVEEALPVYMDLRGRGRQPKVALALVIDKSGSMTGQKVEMAKEAAVRSIRLLRPDDQAAVLAFDTVPQWVAPLTPLSERDALEQAIGRVYAGGGTEIFPAVSAAFAAIRNADADVKHIILLTDGQSGSGGDYVQLLADMREARVSLSTVAVGSDADTGLLEAMARTGRGRYHYADSPENIPQIFARETIMATRTILVDNHFYPAAASAGPLLQGLSSVPPLDGYVGTTAKERGEVVLVSPEGDPVLAAWQYGLGRAVAWTPDVGGRWSAGWTDEPAALTLWSNVLSWLLPAQDTGEVTVGVQTEGETSLVVTAENRSGWEEVRPTTSYLVGPNNQRQEVTLDPAGPGRYQARLDLPEPGAYVVQVKQTTAEGVELSGEAGWVAPYPAEYREAGIAQPFLGQLAKAGNGRVLTDVAEVVSPPTQPTMARWPAWPLLLLLAGILWPLEIASRRLALPAVKWQALRRPELAVGRGRQSGQRQPAMQSGTAVASSTTEHLLERKRALRERRGGHPR
nr:VWA domain-containing protein [Dehalococcoidales bacterium]